MNTPVSGWSALRIHPRDNVLCLLRDHQAGERPDADGVEAPVLGSAVKSGHKVAILDIPAGDYVYKYGHRIGRATCDIRSGDHVHLHNLAGLAEEHEV